MTEMTMDANGKTVFSENLSWALWLLKVCDAKVEPFVEHESIAQDKITLKYLPELEDTNASRKKLGFSEEAWNKWFELLIAQEKGLKKKCVGEIYLSLSDEPVVKEYLSYLYEFYSSKSKISPTYRRMLRGLIDQESIFYISLDLDLVVISGIGNMTTRYSDKMKEKFKLSNDETEHIETVHTKPGFHSFYSTYFMFPGYESEDLTVIKSSNETNLFSLVAEYKKKSKD